MYLLLEYNFFLPIVPMVPLTSQAVKWKRFSSPADAKQGTTANCKLYGKYQRRRHADNQIELLVENMRARQCCS